MILETERLILREMTQADFPLLCKHLQDEEVMYAWEHAYSDDEVQEGLDKQFQRYKQHGFGVWAVILKESGDLIGQCGLSMQPCENREVLEIGYIFQKEHWHKGYATEAAVACREYAFNKLNAEEVFSLIRDTNVASQKVAKRNEMSLRGSYIKHYRGMDMPHYIFSVKRAEHKDMNNIVYKTINDFEKSDLQELFLSVNWSSGHYPDKLVIAMQNFEIVYSAWDGGKLVGLLSAMDDGIMTAYVHYLLVSPAYQHRGIGKKLVEMMKEKYKDYLRIVVVAYNTEQNFYESCGFTKSDDAAPMFITSLWT